MKLEMLLKYLDKENSGKYVVACVGRNPRPCFSYYLFPGCAFEEKGEHFGVAFSPKHKEMILIPLKAIAGKTPVLKHYKCISVYLDKAKEAEQFLITYQDAHKKASRALEIVKNNEPVVISASKKDKLDVYSHAKISLSFMHFEDAIKQWKPLSTDFLEEIEACLHFCSGFWGTERDSFAALLQVFHTRLNGLRDIVDLSYSDKITTAYKEMIRKVQEKPPTDNYEPKSLMEVDEEKLITESQLKGVLVSLTLSNRSCATREEIIEAFKEHFAQGGEVTEEYKDRLETSLKIAKEQEFLVWNRALKQYQMTLNGRDYAYQIMELECRSYNRYMKGKE